MHTSGRNFPVHRMQYCESACGEGCERISSILPVSDYHVAAVDVYTAPFTGAAKINGVIVMKHILCYGDSNTFGTDPIHGGRHPDDVRWTGVLQKLLGSDYRVIEEGCGGRTTVFEDEISYGRNGLKMLIPIIASHNPLDLIVVMLGTNDLKKRCFRPEYEAVARQKNCHFFDAASVAEASEKDRLHMTAENHRKLAAALAKEIQKLLIS